MRKVLVLVLAALLVGLFAFQAAAAPFEQETYLFPKIQQAEDGPWSLYREGLDPFYHPKKDDASEIDKPYGKLEYCSWGNEFKFDFKGYNLNYGETGSTPNFSQYDEYALIYYQDPWGTGVYVLAVGTKDDAGEIHLEGEVDFNKNLPFDTDANYSASGSGAKIWLVPTDFLASSEVGAMTQMTGWHWVDGEVPEILFETTLIIYEDTKIE